MLVFFSISPLGSGESVSDAVAPIVEMIAQSGLDSQTTAMGTLIEGPPDAVFDLLKACHARMKESHNRVASKILIDDRGDETGRIKSKITSLESKLGHKLD